MKSRVRPLPALGFGTTIIALALSACADTPTAPRSSLASPARLVTTSTAAIFGNFGFKGSGFLKRFYSRNLTP